MKKIRDKNIKYILFGYFMLAVSAALLTFFLPFYLKQEGLGILQIGGLFAFGLVIGNLLFGLFYSRILKGTSLRNGLIFTSILAFFQSAIFFILPTSTGVFLSKFTNVIENSSSKISTDVALQHNVSKNKHRKVSSYHLIASSLGIMVGIILAIIFIGLIGFRWSFLVFACFSIIPFFVYSGVSDRTRFRAKKLIKLPKSSLKLKLILFSELLYWFSLASSFALILTFLVVDKFQGSLLWIGFLFICLYFSMAITTLLTKKYLDDKDYLKSSIIGMVILLFNPILIILSNNIYLVFVAMIIEGIGAGIWTPSKSAIYWKLTKKENREKIAGYLFGWRGAVSSLGPLFGGFLVVSFGILAPFYFKAISSLLIIILYLYIFKKG